MMRGASAEALADLTEMVGKSRTLADAATLGAELFGVARVLRSEPALRRVATDSSIEAAAKQGLVKNVFAAKVDEATMKVLDEAVARRWTRSRDLPDAIEHAGVVAVVHSAGASGEKISDELFSVRRMVQSDPALRSAVSDPARSAADRGALVRGLVHDRVLPATEELIAQAIVAAQVSVDAVLKDYQELAAHTHGKISATVRTARELSEGDRERLAAALGKHYGAAVHLHVVHEPDLVGGLRIEIRDDVIDGTVVNRLDDARRQLVG